MKRNAPLLRTALQLQHRLAQRNAGPQRERQRLWSEVQEHAHVVLQRLLLTRRAHSKQWFAAARITEISTLDALQQLRHVVSNAMPQLEIRTAPRAVSLGDLYQDLEQLDIEFGATTLEPKNRLITATTDPIELEDIDLGSFRIELHLDRLVHRADSSAFDIVALQPNPPDCSDDVTHPHVRDRQLCAGDATYAISQGLSQGRITDAFLAVRAVLETYNSGSPYVALSDWHGRPCGDCGCSMSDDESYTCEQCDQSCCEACIGRCDVCDSSFCRSCLEEDIESGRMCCRSCRHRCDACQRVVATDSLIEETGLCPECHEERINQQEQENDHESNTNAEQPDSGSPAQSALPPPTAGAA